MTVKKLNIVTFFWMLIMVFSVHTAVAETHIVEQLDKSFMKNGHKTAFINVKAGDTIKFKNVDTVFHNIFSTSKIKTFNLGAYGYGKSKSITFDKAGKAKVSCAIHPRMSINVIVDK